MSLKNTIKNKQNKSSRFTWNGVEVVIKDKITNPEISIREVLLKIGTKIPKQFLRNVDIIYVGNFDFLKDRDIQAMYENSCIFVTNEQSSYEDMCDDIVHELAHSLEEIYMQQIYSDGAMEKEFLEKRKQLYSILKSESFEVNLHQFLDPDYEKEFDDYLYREIGYPALNMLSTSVFYSPYAATSLREYFANGFEALYYYRDYDFLTKSCPVLFKKLNDLMEIE
tara:strand:- start:38 stop:709 length:672 start_codon:yes stop_codon:yes gene_type:complete